MTDFTTTIPYTASDIESNKNVYTSRSTSGVIRQRATAGQLYSFNLTFRKMTKSEAFPILAFFESHAGQRFSILHPQHLTPLGNPSGSPKINGSNQTGSSIITDGWTPSTSGLMKAGDIVSFGSETKVYRLTSDVNSDASGNATLSIFPDLNSSPSDNAVVNHTGVKFSVVMKGKVQKYSTDKENVYTYKLSLVESL